MERRTRWIWMGAASVAVLGIVLAGCGNNAADNNVAVAPPATNTVTTTHDNIAGDDFKEAATTWGKIEMARADLDKIVGAGKWKEVHEAAFKVRDLVRTLPAQSAALEDDKKKSLQSHVKNVDQLAAMLDEAGDAGNAKSVHEHHMAMNDALGMIKGLYPADVMDDAMHMPGKGMADDKGMSGGHDMDNMNKSGGSGMSGDNMPMNDKPMGDDKMDKMPMGGNKPMSGMGDKKMPMMEDDKMPMGGSKGMGNKPMPNKGKGMSGGNKKPSGGGMSGGGGMSDDNMGGMGHM